MGAALDKVFVIDVEATCWETREEQGNRPNEIIEIGICQIDKVKGIQDISSYLVKPKFTEISPFCTELTGWKPEDVADAPDLATTLLAIGKDYGMTPDHVWFSYGEYDRIKLCSDPGLKASAFGLYGIDRRHNPIAQLRAHFNVKTLMALKEGLSKELGMDRALKFYGEKLEGRHHNGADDAANIAKIVMRVLS